MNVVVVGAGIAGSCVTRAARAAGHTVDLISSGDPASVAALAVMRMGWHRGQELHDAVRALELYRQWGVPLLHGAEVSHYRRAGRTISDDDYHVVHPVFPLVKPDREVRVEEVSAGHVILADGRQPTPDVVVDCRGWGKDYRRSFGATAVANDPSALLGRSSIRVHHIRPYHSLVAARIGGQVRLGSSLGKDAESAVNQLREMLVLGIQQKIVREGVDWTITVGMRAQPPKGFPTLVSRPGLVVYRGLHRTGYSTAPAEAERIVRNLEAA